MCSRLAAAVCLCVLVSSAQAGAQTLTPDVARGLAWLQSQVQPDGRLSNEGSSIGTAYQNRTEAARTLAALADLPTSLADAIAAETEDNTEYLARRVLALRPAGRDVSSLISALLSRQNADGGYGGARDHESNALDTAWALLACKAGDAGPAAVSRALGYLTARQDLDGAYRVGDRADVYTTALALQALGAHGSRFTVTSSIDRAVAYLAAHRLAPGNWDDSPFLSSLAYAALHDFVPKDPAAGEITAFLRSRQSADGSWSDGDPYVTALALRALALAGTPPANPTRAIVQGTVLDGQTGVPLAGVAVALTGAASGSAVTGSDGQFQLRDLAPGTYTLDLTFVNYGRLTTTTGAAAGQTVDLGLLQMSQAGGATTGTVLGTATDAMTGLPLAGVSIGVLGGAAPVLTDAAGGYQISNVATGTTLVVASLAGYASVSTKATMSAGSVLVFSPALAPGDVPTATTLQGRVTIAANGIPLAGVVISLFGATTASTTTDGQGEYSITGLNAGPTQITASFPGFDTVAAFANILTSSTSIFSPRMYPTGTTPLDSNTAAVTGLVVDAGTGAPLANVLVSASYGVLTVSARTGADGRFNFAGITTDSVALGFALVDYEPRSMIVSLPPLQTQDVGPVRLRRAGVAQLLPDLVAKSASREGAITDPQTLAVSGSVTVTVANVGTTNAPAGVRVLAFHDANRNGVYDAGQDAVLGETTIPVELAVDAQLAVPIPVAGSLPFRDAPIHVWVDSAQSVVESDERNNVIAVTCEFGPPPTINIAPIVGVASANSVFVPGTAPQFAIDGNVNSMWNAGWWATPSSPLWMVVDLQRAVKVSTIVLQDIRGTPGVGFYGFNNIYNLYVSADGTTWTRVASGTLTESNDPAQYSATIPLSGPLSVLRYVKYEVVGGTHWAHLNDLEIWAPDPRPTTLLLENFNDGNADGWQPLIGRGGTPATVIDGEYVRTSNGASYVGDTNWTDYTAEIRIRFPNGPSNDAGLAFRVRNPNDWYTVRIQGGIIRLLKFFDGGNFAVLQFTSAVVPSDPNFWNVVKVEVVGSTVKGYLNGKLLIDYTGLDWPNGAVGTEQDGVLVHYDDLLVTTIGTPAPQDVSASYLRIEDGGAGPSRFTARVGNSGGTLLPTGLRVAFYNGPPGAGGVLLGTALTTRALASGEYEDVSFTFVGSLAGMAELVAVADDDGRLAECNEINNRVSYVLAALPGVFSVTVATDQPSYGPEAAVAVTAAVTNSGSLDREATVRFRIETAEGTAVTTLSPAVTIPVPHSASRPASALWNTGTTVVGNYRVTAELLDGTGQPFASAIAPFSIVTGAGARASGRVTTDKTAYLASDTVQITSRVTNVTVNDPLSSIAVVTTLLAPDGTSRFTRSELVPQLGAGALKDFTYSEALALAPAGDYRVTLSVRDAGGAALATATTSFVVQSSAATGSGLTGTLSASPKPIPFGDPITFTASVNNLGSADIPDIAASVTVVDPVAQQALANFPVSLTLAQHQSATLSFRWPARATVGGTYPVVLSAVVGGRTLTLAQDTFSVVPAVVRLTGAVTVAPKEVVAGDAVVVNQQVTNVGFRAVTGLPIALRIVDAATNEVVAQFLDTVTLDPQQTSQKIFTWTAVGAVGTHYTAVLTATVDGAARTLGQDTFTVIAPPVNLAVTLASHAQARVLVLLSCRPDEVHEDPDCVVQRRAFLNAYLTSLGVMHVITISDTEFQTAFRSGVYNTYWISGGREKLAAALAEEVREAVHRGDALLLDGVHDERNAILDPVIGADVAGKLSPVNETVDLTGTVFAPGPIATVGRPLRLGLTTGQAQAGYPASAGRPAIVTNQYGQGRGLLFGFDLVGTLMADAASTRLADVSQAAIGWLTPAAGDSVVPGDYVVVRTRVENVGQAVDLRVTVDLPVGAAYFASTPVATVAADGRPVWTVSLASGQAIDLDAAIRAPMASGTATVNVTIDAVRNGVTRPYNTYALSLVVHGAAAIGPEVVSGLQALAVAQAEQAHRDIAIGHIQTAQTRLGAQQYGEAIAELLESVKWLLKISSADVSPYRLAVDRLLDEAAYRWYLGQPH